MKNEHIRYVHDKPKYRLKVKSGTPKLIEVINKRATFVSYFDSISGFIRAGWSLCERQDRFENKEGLEIARGRCNSAFSMKNVPRSIKDQFQTFVNSEKEYWNETYKGAGIWNIKT